MPMSMSAGRLQLLKSAGFEAVSCWGQREPSWGQPLPKLACRLSRIAMWDDPPGRRAR